MSVIKQKEPTVVSDGDWCVGNQTVSLNGLRFLLTELWFYGPVNL